MRTELAMLLEDTHHLCDALAPVFRKKLGQKGKIEVKNGGELVGELDKEVEGMAKRMFARTMPDIPVLSEEDDHEWPPKFDDFILLDPMDGTHNFLMGMPTFGVMLSLFEKRELVLSSFYLPLESMMGLPAFYFAIKGGGAWMTGKDGRLPLKVSGQKKLDETFLVLEGPSKKIEASELAHAAKVAVRRYRAGISCVWGFTRVAMGGTLSAPADVMLSIDNKPTDNMHGCLLIEEAGGKVTDLNGNPWSLENCSTLLYSNGHLHEQVLALTK